MLKDVRAMFLTPLYMFTFPGHRELKDIVLHHLENTDVFTNYSPQQHIRLSHPNLHKEPVFREHYDFMNDSLNQVMFDMGYTQEQSITAMWASCQRMGMHHHPHKHGNSFLAGTYYLHGNSETHGTSFINPDNLPAISPNKDPNKVPRLNPIYNSQFIEGDFIVFPAWVLHNTYAHRHDEPRYVLGVNSMPVGKTIDEPYDRFNYPRADDLDLDFNVEELIRYNPRMRE